jgi:hypothetical protein
MSALPRSFRSVPAAAVALALVATLLAATPAPAAVSCPDAPSVIPAAEILPGMTGTGLTTVTGSTPTSFEIEIIGTLENAILPGHDLVMFEITGPPSFLDAAHGFFAGMSGSPVFIDGRLAGATSWRFTFSDAAIGLFTPAEEMIRLVDAPSTETTVSIPLDARRAVARAAGVTVATVPDTAELLPTPLAVSGLSTSALRDLQTKLDERGLRIVAVPAARPAAAVDPTPLAPGSPMGAALSTGDVSFVGIGTTTFLCGDNVNVGWGHPFFFQGASTFALTDASVVTVLNDPSGIFGPYMIANPGDLHGTVVEDRWTGIIGQAGAVADPMSVTSLFTNLDTGDTRDGSTDVYYQEDWWGADIAWYHMYLNLLTVFDRFGSGSLDMAYTISGLRQDGSTPFTVSNTVLSSSTYDASEGVYKLSNALYTLQFNRFEDITFTSVDASGGITEQRLEGTIGRIRSSSSVQSGLQSRSVQKVRPGGRVTVEVSLEPFEGGDPVLVTFTMRAPRRPGFYDVRLRGGRDRFYVDERELESFDDLVAQLSGGLHANDVVARGLGPAVSTSTSLVVTGRGGFTVQVVR